MRSSRPVLLAAAVVALAGAGVGIQQATGQTACERYQEVAAEYERAERGEGDGDLSFEAASRQVTEALAECMQEDAERAR